MTLIDLLRHGATTTPGSLVGRTDSELTDTGRAQIERQTAGRTWSVVVSSPLGRACRSAEQLAQRLKLELRIDPDWSELDFGEWEGRTPAELRADPDAARLLERFHACETGAPAGESWQQLTVRVERGLRAITREAGDRPVLVVTHAGPIRAAVAVACGLPLPSLWTLRIDYGTRVTLNVAIESGVLWGEIVEIRQA